MPYIKKDRRPVFSDRAYGLGQAAESEGELNYALTQVIRGYLHDKTGYQHINAVVGALECCKLEFYRREVAKYEDEKIRSNGDVYF